MAHNGRPQGKMWETYAEFTIRNAREKGAFEHHLPGTGKPIPGLDAVGLRLKNGKLFRYGTDDSQRLSQENRVRLS